MPPHRAGILFLRLERVRLLRLIRACPAVAEALLLSGAVRLGFMLKRVGPTQAFIRRWAALPRTAPADALKASLEAQRLVTRLTGFTGTCLERSLVLWALLRRRGAPAELVVGMRKREGKTEGHAWVELHHSPVNEKPAVTETYSVFEGAVPLGSGSRLPQ